ncbi:hypothetical protein JVT61DRAFT_2274 [Boletus reticuloceps]|uniref:PAS domain-containing protein n=1 Tax=Boletus reticuloceps TaxID=495285 RepID=A0A8I3AB57_9AGAM|nr:hypothetical protein JVT61DRAFT_2274 [Boletus reticuloceps]
MKFAVLTRLASYTSRPSLTSRTVVSHARMQSTIAPRRTPRVLPSFSLENKVCVVTGAARGLGNEFCNAFVQSGCTRLAIIDLKESEAKVAADELVQNACVNSDSKREDFEVIGIGCDVSSELSVQKAFEVVMDTFGRVDSVVASAVLHTGADACHSYPFDRIKRLYDINVHGAFFTAREAARNMIPQGGGSIVLVGSMSASVPLVLTLAQPQTPYNASKAAVRHMGSSLAVEWAKKGVRVNTLSPGYMMTKLTKTILAHDAELKKTWESLTPMGKMGEPEDLSGAIVFLASDASRFMTGTELSDAIIFVLSRDAKIWFCGRAVSELLGWSDAELIDCPFTDLVNPEDQRAFHVAFDESLRTRTEMNSYVRLKARSHIIPHIIPQSEVLFEVKAIPTLSKTKLKIENERLQKRLADLRVRAPSPSAPISGPSTSPAYSLRSSSVSRSSVPSSLSSLSRHSLLSASSPSLL